MGVGVERPKSQNLGRIVPEVGADRPRLGRTWGGSTLGRIDRNPLKSTVAYNVVADNNTGLSSFV